MQALVSLRQSTGAARCVACGKCTTMCPLGKHGDFSARRIASQDLEDELRGRGVGVGRCLTCASCEVRCPEGVRFTDFVRGLRELVPPEVRRAAPHGGLFQSIARAMQADGGQRSRTEGVPSDLEVAEEGTVALFVGCAPYFDVYFSDLGVHTLDSTRAAIRILNQCGIRPVLVGGEVCCGHDLLWRGEREEFENLARANTRAFAERGIQHVLTTCAECCRTWKLDYPEIAPDYTPRVEHLSEFVAARLQSGELTARPDGETPITYQDPCRLGRHLGVVDAPRRFFEALPDTPFVEMPRSGRDALCCGTSGFIHCDGASRELQQQRLGEAATTEARKLVTACPKCLIHFKCAQAEDRRRAGTEPRIEIEDFTVLAARSVVHDGEVEQAIPVPQGREAGESR